MIPITKGLIPDGQRLRVYDFVMDRKVDVTKVPSTMRSLLPEALGACGYVEGLLVILQSLPWSGELTVRFGDGQRIDAAGTFTAYAQKDRSSAPLFFEHFSKMHAHIRASLAFGTNVIYTARVSQKIELIDVARVHAASMARN